MICEANHGWFAEMLHNGISIFSTANLGSEPSRGSQKSKSNDLDFFVCAAGTISFDRRATSF